MPRDGLRAAALAVAATIAEKSPTVIRAAKERLNGIDPWDVKRSYRFEQGFTFELNLSGVSDQLRDDFAGTDKASAPGSTRVTADKRITEDEAIATLRDGMTIGIGGWGSRRKPMSLVRALLRSSLSDLTVVSYGGPDVGLLARRAGSAGSSTDSSRSTRSRSSPTSVPPARSGSIAECVEYDEGMLQWALYAGSLRLPFLPTRAGLGSGVMDVNPDLRTVRSPYADGEELLAVPAIRLDAAFVHLNRADRAGQRAVPRARPVLRRPLPRRLRAGPAVRLVRADRCPPRRCSTRERSTRCGSTARWSTA